MGILGKLFHRVKVSYIFVLQARFFPVVQLKDRDIVIS